MPQYLTERNFAEQLVVTKAVLRAAPVTNQGGIEGVKRVNEGGGRGMDLLLS